MAIADRTSIEVSMFETVRTIVFLNKHNTPPSLVVWVAADNTAYQVALADLKKSKHIEIIQQGHSHVQF